MVWLVIIRIKKSQTEYTRMSLTKNCSQTHQGNGGKKDTQETGCVPTGEGVWDGALTPHSPTTTTSQPPIKVMYDQGDGCALVRALCLKMLMDGRMERSGRRRRRKAGDVEMTMMKGRCATLSHLGQLFSDGG